MDESLSAAPGLSALKESALYNKDLAPVGRERRTWGTYNYAALWVSMSVCIPTYMLGSGLIAAGMNWWQAILTIMLGNLIVLVPMVLNAHAGTKFGIPFPVLARASFGTLGSNIPAILRALVACGWFGIQTWIGGSAINVLMANIFPGWAQFSIGIWVSFFAFWLINIIVILLGIETIKFLEALNAPFMLGVGLALLAWALWEAGGLGPILAQPSRFATAGEFFAIFVPSLTAMVGFWATVALNIPDFTRYAKGQREQMLGQALGLPTTMTLYSFIGVAVTSASAIIFGQAIWDPVALISKFRNRFAVFVALIALTSATLNTNVAANVVSPSNDFSNLYPKKISFKMGGIITGIIGILMMPWKLLADQSAYIYGWLVGYSGFLGPIAGIMICDYYLIRRRHLEVYDLYVRAGRYEYSRGFNKKAIVALAFGVGVALIGLVVEPLRFLYDYAWFVGFAAAFLLYYLIMEKPQLKYREA